MQILRADAPSSAPHSCTLPERVVPRAALCTTALRLALALLASSSASAQVPRLHEELDPPANVIGAENARLVDVDRDGDADLVVLDKLGAQIELRLNDGAGRFAAPCAVAVASRPRDQDWTDEVGAIAGWGASRISVLTFQGPGAGGCPSFARSDVDTIAAPCLVRLGDFDADGLRDLLVVNDTQIALHLGDAGGGFGAPVAIPLGAQIKNPRALVTGDFDADGRLDFALTCGGMGLPPRFDIFWNQWGNASAPWVQVNWGNWFGSYNVPLALAAGDLDGDQRTDLALTYGSGTLAVALNTSCRGLFLAQVSGTDASGAAYALGQGSTLLALADLDGDQSLDLIFREPAAGGFRALFNRQQGDFSCPPPQDVEFYGSLASVNPGAFACLDRADLDGDGDVDLAVVCRGSVGLGTPWFTALLSNQTCANVRQPVTALQLRGETLAGCAADLYVADSNSWRADACLGSKSRTAMCAEFATGDLPGSHLAVRLVSRVLGTPGARLRIWARDWRTGKLVPAAATKAGLSVGSPQWQSDVVQLHAARFRDPSGRVELVVEHFAPGAAAFQSELDQLALEVLP